MYSSSFKSMLIRLMKFRIFNQWLVATSSSAGHYSLSLFCPNVSDFPCQPCSGCLSLGPCCLMADWNLRMNCFHFSQVEEARETCEGLEGNGVLRVSSSRVSRCRYLLAKRKRRRRRAKAWKEKKSHASLSRASLFPLPFCLAEEARETREGMEGKGLPRASSVSITF